jgi:predicted MFS family arabinose efflux permease
MDDAKAESVVRGYPGRLLLTISLGWAFLQAGRLVISPLLPQITADLEISSALAGIAITVMWATYAVLQYPSGRLSDRLSRKTLLVTGLLLLCLGFGVLANAELYVVFLLGAAVVGVGAGLYPTPARSLVSDLFVRRRGQAFGLHTASGDVGGVLAAVLATVVIGVATWRTVFAPVVAVLLLVALALHVWSREPYVFARVDLEVGSTIRRLFVEPKLRWLLVAYSLFAFTWQATTGFLPTFLQVSKDFSPVVANASFALLFVIGAVTKPVAGWLSDRVSRDALAPAVLGVAATMLAGVLVVDGELLVAIGIVGFALGLMAYPPVMQAYLMDVFETETMGGDLGAMRSVYIGISSLGTTYVGVVAEFWNFTVAFAGLLACLIASATIIYTVGRR